MAKKEGELKSTSGKYKSIRHLLEILFAKDPEYPREKADALVKKEFPNAKYNRKPPKKTSFPFYKTHIVSYGEFQTIPAPAWAKRAKKKQWIKTVEKKDAKRKKKAQRTKK